MKLNMAVSTSSIAETNVFKTELKVFIKRDVIIPIDAFMKTMAITNPSNPLTYNGRGVVGSQPSQPLGWPYFRNLAIFALISSELNMLK